jgi:FkbM family methyltransferase
MGYKSTALRAADRIVSAIFFANQRMPTFYCGRLIWIPSTMWNSIYSRYELAVARAIKDYLKEGQIFWDIGANVGWFSLFASKFVGVNGRVFAFEPSPEVFDVLSTHAKIVHGVTPIHCGVGGSDEVRTFSAHGKSSSSSFIQEVTNINLRFLPSEPIRNLEVRLRKVDSLVKELGSKPSVLKIDVEGFELEVLRGAGDLLAYSRPTLIVEVHPRQLVLSGGTEMQLFQLLRDRQYKWKVIDRNPNSLYTIVAAPIEAFKEAKFTA